MRPSDVARLETRYFVRRVVAVALGGARVHELEPAVSDDGLYGIGTFHVIEIAEHNQSGVGIGGEMRVNNAAQNLRLLQAQLGFVGVGHWTARLQMRGNEREGEIGLRPECPPRQNRG